MATGRGDTPMGVADPGLDPQLQAAMELAASATVVVEAMTNIRDPVHHPGVGPGASSASHFADVAVIDDGRAAGGRTMTGRGEGLAHLVGDYVLQTDWMATQKTVRWGPALAHGATYTAAFLPLTRNWKALAVIGGTHTVIDRYRLAKHVAWLKNQAAPAEYRPPHTATGYREDAGWLGVALLIITDNTCHLLLNRWALNRWGR